MKIYLLILGILLISSIYAVELNAGDTYQINLDKPYSYYTITGNSTPLDLNISSIGNLVNITTSKYYNDSFTITFYGEEDEVVSSGGSGQSWGSSKKKVTLKNETIKNNTNINTNIPENKTIEEQTETENKFNWLYIIIPVGILLIVIFFLRRKYTNERRLENEREQKKETE